MASQDPNEPWTTAMPGGGTSRSREKGAQPRRNGRDNADWQRSLARKGRAQTEALRDLRALIFSGLRAYLQRQVVARRLMSGEDAEHLAQDCTQDAVVRILDKLDSFRGESRFTTWVYTVAVRILLGELRRRRWQDLSLDPAQLGSALPDLPADESSSPDPELAAQRQEVWALIQELIESSLTERQRFALVAHVFQEMPLDLLAKRLRTHRDNVYKLIHDARKKLKLELERRGFSRSEMAGLFGLPGKKRGRKAI